MSKHTSGAVKVGERIAFAIWPEERGFTKKDSWISQKVEEFATIVDQETAAERDKLREALMDCEHVMNITANQLCTAVDQNGLTGANKRLVECVIRTRITLYETAPAETEGGDKSDGS